MRDDVQALFVSSVVSAVAMALDVERMTLTSPFFGRVIGRRFRDGAAPGWRGWRRA